MNDFEQKTSDLIRNGELERAWQRHCGFLDLTTDEFMQIQWRLLQEQFVIANQGRLWQTLFPGAASIEHITKFRQATPLTTYNIYAELLAGKPEDILGRPIVAWARTSGRGGQPKWAPYTREAYLQLGMSSVASHILSTARSRGDINVRPNDIVALNLPARPFLSGIAIRAVAELFDFRFMPPLEESEKLGFQERITRVFQQAMKDGMDILGSMTIVLVKMGEQFEKGANQKRKFSLSMLDPRVLFRYARAMSKARRDGRAHILPRDLWSPKGLMCGGTDTAQFREQIKTYWGIYPHESYACTETGFVATQAWDHREMIFIPSSAFYEFIPEEDWAAERLQGTVPSRTLLLNELEVGKRYEVVVTSFYGGPFLRYRLHDLIEISSLTNLSLGINVPQFHFVGRSGDFIDLSGFAGLIDEKQILQSLKAAQVDAVDWVVCKELLRNEPALHLYIEQAAGDASKPALSEAQIADGVHRHLKQINPDYGNIETMLGFIPLRVTFLPAGSFDRFTKSQVARGADLAHLKPAHIQPSPQALALLLGKN
ncbi:MAG: GH3 auxin-responsive promoter family protein [Chloroflexi bacterium]|nr:GH3 auxin-responsive promoter family protein [Chloroflexota bacterium]